jgi:hypothetical protein
MTDQLIVFQPGGQIMPTFSLSAPLNFAEFSDLATALQLQ